MTSKLRILLTEHIDFLFGVEWLRLATADERALSVDLPLLLRDFLACSPEVVMLNVVHRNATLEKRFSENEQDEVKVIMKVRLSLHF